MNTSAKGHRRSIQLKGYDYAQAGLFFITLCCQNRAHLFGEILHGKMILNDYGKIAASEWRNTEIKRENCEIHDFIIMPNHMHGIIEIKFKKGEENERGKFKSPSQTIGSIIRGYKKATIKKIKDLINNNIKIDLAPSTGELQFALTEEIAPTEIIKSLDFKIWQRNYYEHIIRNEQAFLRIATYINNNPRKWDEDKFFIK